MLQTFQLISTKLSIRSALTKLKTVLAQGDVWPPKEEVQFVFLCGGNLGIGKPSKRRELILDFAQKNLPNSSFFLAESIFTVIREEGHRKNILDVESELSDLSDTIIIVLESESAFCELGAFTKNQKARKKLIIINDSVYVGAQSFINMGPIEAIKEEKDGANRILHYKMDQHGKERADAIGNILPALGRLLEPKVSSRRSRIKDINPNNILTKNSIRLVHDLVHLTQPIYFNELVVIIDFVFGSCEEDRLKYHLGLLCATNQIAREKRRYISKLDKLYLEFSGLDIYGIMSSFRNLYLKHNSERLG